MNQYDVIILSENGHPQYTFCCPHADIETIQSYAEATLFRCNWCGLGLRYQIYDHSNIRFIAQRE